MSIQSFISQKIGGKGAEEVGIGGFTMLARVRETYDISAEAPSTYLEDGSSVEDHIIQNPVLLTIEGAVSDVYVAPSAVQQLAPRVAATVGQIGVYLPSRTAAQAQKAAALASSALDQVRRLDRIVNDGAQVLSLLGDKAPAAEAGGLQAKFTRAMEALVRGGQRVNIDMPYRTFKNMYVTLFQPSWDNQAKVTRFKLVAKEIRIADESTGAQRSLIASPSEGLSGTADPTADKGVQAGKPTPTSLLGTITGLF